MKTGESVQKIVSIIMLDLLIIGMLSLAFNIQPAEANGTIYIRADGSIDPPTAPIQRIGNLYTLTSNIYGSIVVEKDNIVIDGADHSIQTEGYVWKGIDLTGRRNVTVKNMQIIGFSNGIYLADSSGNTISGTDIIGGDYGLWIWNSSYNNICCNKITKHHEYGVIITFSNNNIISENNIEENGCGIYFEHSSNNILKGNILNENAENIHVAFQSLSDCVHNIDASNTVNGKPIYYWVNQQNKTVPSNAGYVALVNCTNIKVQNLKLVRNGQGILLLSTKDSVIANNTLENNGYGILIFDSQNINITGNMVVCNQLEGFKAIFSEGIRVIVSNRVLIDGNYIAETGTGILLSGSTQVVISRNNITSNTNRGIECVFSNGNMIFYNYIWNNTYAGINLVDSDENRVIGNTMIENNGWGVRLSGADNNTFYHNNFINNKVVEGLQVSNPWYWGRPEPNTWDNGAEGNYWSDYKSRYPNATEVDSLGIGDTPYFINEVNIDRYPLIRPFVTPPTVIILPDTTPPTVSIISPENKTYTGNNVSLIFTVSEPASWIGYSLDGQANVTITGNTTLTGLSDGSHSLKVYAKDAAGNTGASETVYFTIAQKSEPFPTTWIVIIAIGVIAIGIAITLTVIYKRKSEQLVKPHKTNVSQAHSNSLGNLVLGEPS